MSWVQDQRKRKWVVLSSRPKNENELSWVQDQKNENELSWVQDQKKLKWVVLSSRPKKK